MSAPIDHTAAFAELRAGGDPGGGWTWELWEPTGGDASLVGCHESDGSHRTVCWLDDRYGMLLVDEVLSLRGSRTRIGLRTARKLAVFASRLEDDEAGTDDE